MTTNKNVEVRLRGKLVDLIDIEVFSTVEEAVTLKGREYILRCINTQHETFRKNWARDRAEIPNERVLRLEVMSEIPFFADKLDEFRATKEEPARREELLKKWVEELREKYRRRMEEKVRKLEEFIKNNPSVAEPPSRGGRAKEER